MDDLWAQFRQSVWHLGHHDQAVRSDPRSRGSARQSERQGRHGLGPAVWYGSQRIHGRFVGSWELVARLWMEGSGMVKRVSPRPQQPYACVLTYIVYEEYAGSWLFHSETFKAKLGVESYLVQHPHRSYFLKKWIPERYPDYRLTKSESETKDFETWALRTRAAVREKTFTMFPHVADGYYVKRLRYFNEVEECNLRDLLTVAIPSGTDGWQDDFDLPNVINKQAVTHGPLDHSLLMAAVIQHGEPTSPPSPTSTPITPTNLTPPVPDLLLDPQNVPLYIDALPRQPPYHFKPSPPPKSMSAAARLTCLACWTAFSTIGSPHLLPSPRAKNIDLQWRNAIEAGCSREELMRWAKDMW